MFLSDPGDRDITFGEPGTNATMAEVLKGLDRTNNPDFEAINKRGEDFGAGVVAAYRQNRLVNFTSSRDAAMAEATDHRIAIVQEQTGIVLENPFRSGYFGEASRRVDETGGAGNLQDNRYAAIIARQREVFDERFGEVLTNFPDKAKALDFGQSIEDQAKAISAAADHDGENHQGGLLASLVGGVAASARDPLQVAALFATGGESVAGTALARVGWNALRQGLLNAGISAVEQPAVQEWRRDIGVKNGVVPSLENVGMNFLFGAIIGGAVHGGVELVRADRAALQRVMDGTGTPADVEAAARGLGVTIPPDTRAALGLAEADASHAAVARADLPEGLPPGLGDDIERQAIRYAQDPAHEPPPALASPPVTRPDSAAAARVMDDAAQPLDGVVALRGDPALVEGALHAPDPSLRQAGRLAALSDEAFDLIQSGRAEPGHGVIVSELSPDPTMDAPVLARLAQAAAETPAEARLIAADAIEGEARRRATAAQAGAEATTIYRGSPLPEVGVVPANLARDGSIHVGRKNGLHFEIELPPDIRAGLKPGEYGWKDTGFVNPQGEFLTREEALKWVTENEKKITPSDNMASELDALDYREQVPMSRRSAGNAPVQVKAPRGRAAADPETWSLFEMLAREGGLKPDPELAAIFGGTRGPFIPSFGPLIRPAGRDLDDALRMAKDRGYMFDAADVTGIEASLVPRDLLDRLDAESRGQRQYRMDRAPIERDTTERDAHRIVADLHDEIARSSGDPAFTIDKAIEDRVVQIMTKEGGNDVLSAFERAIMEDADRYDAAVAARQQSKPLGEIDGWDIPFDGEPAPRNGGDAAASGGPAGGADAGTGGADGAQSRNASGGDRAPGEGPSVAIEMPDGTRRDVIDLVPMMREDGTVILSTPEAVAMMGDHQEGLANLIKGCRLE